MYHSKSKLFNFEDKTYYVVLHNPEHMWDVIDIYEYNPKKIFFKKHFVYGCLAWVEAEIAEDCYKKEIYTDNDLMLFALQKYLGLI